MKDVMVLTTNEAPGYEIEEIHGYISVNYVSGADFLKDFFAGFTSIFGGISESYTDEITELKEEARYSLEKKAKSLNMNCILGVKIDLDPIFGDKYSMFMVSATGTAVRLKGYNSVENASSAVENDIRIELENMYTTKNQDNINYDFTKLSKRKFEECLQEFTDEQIRKLIDNVLKTYKEAYTVAALTENKAKIDMLSKHIVNKNLVWVEEYLHKDIDKSKALLIRDMKLVNYKAILKNLQNKNEIESLFIALTAKPLYINEEQFHDLENLIEYIKTTYNDEVELREVGSFKKKTVWVCKKCKGSVDMDIENCPTCEIDKMGLKSTLKAKNKVQHLLNIRDAISKYYVK